MRRSLTFKFVIAFLAVTHIVLLLVAVPAVVVAAIEFNRLVLQEATNNFTAFVTDYYTTHGNLAGIDDALRQNLQLQIFPTALTDLNGAVIIGADDYQVGQTVSAQVLATGTPIQANGQVIAVGLPRPGLAHAPPRTRAQEQFIHDVTVTLGVAMSGASLLTVLLGILFGHTLARPVRELTRAARQMARGNLAQTVNVQSRDEVGELAIAFNQMSAGLARADQARRQMTADIAHELRNPLTVIGGYLDAMRVGDLSPTPARLEAMYDELQHLEHLVDDLRTLSLADAGALVLNRQALAPGELLNRVAARFVQQAEQKQITLTVRQDGALPEIQVDEARLMQCFSNLISNALRHTPPRGQVRLLVQQAGNNIRFSVEDTGEGIRPEDLGRVFERFYRGDPSRFGREDESGLGLAIAKAFVEAHGGKIWAESAPGKGATFVVELPVTDWR